MATYPYSQDAFLVNSITTKTVVSIVSGMQVAVVTFTNDAGVLGTITLSPVQPVATNVEMKAGTQILQIDNLTFRAQFGFDSGQVTASGNATDQAGKDQTSFSKQIASWS